MSAPPDFSVDAQSDITVSYSKRFSYPIGDFVVAPEFSYVYAATFFDRHTIRFRSVTKMKLQGLKSVVLVVAYLKQCFPRRQA